VDLRARASGHVARRERVRGECAPQTYYHDKTTPAPRTNFVALKVAPNRADHSTTIELIGRHGDRMRGEVHGEVDLRGLVQVFGSMQP
jgi:hypothetical protein